VCSQGELIPPLLATLTADGHRDRETDKGAGWVLSFAGAQLVHVDAFDPRVIRQ
jgi:hypothetical protein